MSEKSVQERYAPHNACFGCGQANPKGLRVRSFPDPAGNGLVACWQSEPHHEAFPGVLSGGIIGTLLDCHSNWTTVWHLMQAAGDNKAPCCVTANYEVRLKRPTPTDRALALRSKVVESGDNWALIEATLTADDKVCAECTGKFVAVEPGHPAYNRW